MKVVFDQDTCVASTWGHADSFEAGVPKMVGEDFARYGSTKENIPTAMYWLGTVPKERMDRYIAGEYALPALHSPFYYPDIENSIRTGVKVSTESLIELFNK